MRHPSNQIYSQLCKTRNKKIKLKIKKNNLNTIHTSSRFMRFQNKIWIVFTLLFFWFLLKLPIVDRELLSYIHLICQKSRYMDIWMCHRCCHKIGKFEIKESQLDIEPDLRNQKPKKWCVVPIGNEKKNNLNTIHTSSWRIGYPKIFLVPIHEGPCFIGDKYRIPKITLDQYHLDPNTKNRL